MLLFWASLDVSVQDTSYAKVPSSPAIGCVCADLRRGFFCHGNCLMYLVQVTSYVAMLSRWMAAELYAKEIEVLMFELSMSKCSQELWDQCRQLANKQSEKAAGASKPEGLKVRVPLVD
jgi:hypothetical protein